MQLRKQGVNLEQEDNAAVFLGITLGCDKEIGLTEMKQVGIIDRVTEKLGLDDGIAKRNFTTSESKPLVKYVYVSGPCEIFSYNSVVGILLYLSGHTSPDIAYAVNFCARYMFCPKHFHETALKRIGHYLKDTRYRGLIFNPSSNVCKLDFYPDAYFLQNVWA